MKRILVFMLALCMSFYIYADVKIFKVNPQDTKEMSKLLRTFLSDNGKMYSDESAGKIIIEDTPENMFKYLKIYNDYKYDENPRQIMIETRIIEVGMDKNNNYGFEWELEKEFEIGSSDHSLNSKINLPSAQYVSGGTFNLSTLNSNDFDGVLNLLESKENVNIISNPKLFVKDGKKADILIGQKIPVKKSIMDNGVVKTSTEFMDVGIKLVVAPKIVSGSDMVNLKISPEISEFVAWSPGDNQPIIDTINANTEVIVKDKSVIAIGGLIKVDMTESFMKVPVLGSFPVIGKLFRRKQHTKERKEIIIFLTPNIQKNFDNNSYSDAANEVKEKDFDYDSDKIWYDMKYDTGEITF